MKQAAAERGTRPCTGLPMPVPPRPVVGSVAALTPHAAPRLVPPGVAAHAANSPRPPPVPPAEREPTLHIPDDVLRHLRRGDGTLLGAPPPPLQPRVLKAATPRVGGCNPTCWRLQPHVLGADVVEAATPWVEAAATWGEGCIHPHAHVHVHVCSRLPAHGMCPGEHPQLCESAIVCVAAHRGSHGQAPLQLSMLGLMLGHVLSRPHAAILAALVPRFSGIAILPRGQGGARDRLSDGERRLRLQAADLAACNAVLQRLLLKVERRAAEDAVREQRQAERGRQREAMQFRQEQARGRQQLEGQVRAVLNRVLTQVERGAERDAKGAAREVSALLGVMVRQVPWRAGLHTAPYSTSCDAFGGRAYLWPCAS